MSSSNIKEKWESGKVSEITFWLEFLAKRSKTNRFYEFTEPIQDRYKKYIDINEKTDISILDVGSGPLTVISNIWPEINLSITMVDPLADEYNKILDKYNIVVPVRPQKCEVEKLSDIFPKNHFDFVHMKNSLDHSYDPISGINQMLNVVKPKCYVYLQHHINVAETNEYFGFHQWNFCEEKGDFILWNKSKKISLKEEIKGIATLEVKEEHEENRDDVIAIIHKL